MPNYCDCDLVIYVDDSIELQKVYSLIIKEDGEKKNFDFNSLIPYPVEFREMDDKAKEAENRNEHIRDGYNSGGYEWCLRNWGTKWNALDCKVEKDDFEISIHFLTAWSPCHPVIAKLADMFPFCSIEYEWYEKGMEFCGSSRYRDGKRIEHAEANYYGKRGG